MFLIGRNELRVPEGTDGPGNVPLWLNRLATDLSTAALDDQGTLAARPVSTGGAPSNKPGRYWYVTGDSDATQNGRLWRDMGAGWVEVAMVLRGSATWDPPSIAAGDYAFTSVSVPGAILGDVCSAALAAYAGAHVVVSAHVSSADTVVVTLHNARLTGSTDPASGTVRVVVVR